MRILLIEDDTVLRQVLARSLAAAGHHVDSCDNLADASTLWALQPFDAVLLDAPCTASGIVRRHPDARWLRRESDVAQLAEIQRQLLLRLWPLVRPGGRLLYCTCSVFRQEGQAQIETFAQYNTDAHLLPSWGHLRPQNASTPPGLADNLQGDHDGFYYALLEKRAAQA